MDWFLYGISFIYGITIGSFLNVCIYRIPEKMSIVKPRSRCGACGRTLKALDLIPLLSWLMLRGKCRSCAAKISVRYPLVEALTGVLFVLAWAVYGFSPMLFVAWLFICLMLVMLFVDLDHKIIPNRLVMTGTLMGLLLGIYQLVWGYPLYDAQGWLPIAMGAFIPFAVMLVLALISMAMAGSGALGMGDVKIYLPIGMFLGWRLGLFSIWLTFLLGGLFGVLWIFILKRDKRAMIPFGPFIAISSLIMLFWGTKALNLFSF